MPLGTLGLGKLFVTSSLPVGACSPRPRETLPFRRRSVFSSQYRPVRLMSPSPSALSRKRPAPVSLFERLAATSGTLSVTFHCRLTA